MLFISMLTSSLEIGTGGSLSVGGNAPTTTLATSVGIIEEFVGNPSVYGDIIAFSSPPNSPSTHSHNVFLMYYNMSTGVLTNTTIDYALFPSVYQNEIAFINEYFLGGTLVIGLYDVSTGHVTSIVTPTPLFDIYTEIAWAVCGGSVVSLGDRLLAYYDNFGAWCYDRTGAGWKYLGGWGGVSVYGDTVAFSNGTTICYYNATTGIITDTGVVGRNPSIFGSIITFHRPSTSPPIYNSTIRYYNITSGTHTDTGIVGDGASIYGNTVAFASNETLANTDLNGDGYLNETIIQYFDISRGVVMNTSEIGVGNNWERTSIHGDVIVFVALVPGVGLFVRFVNMRDLLAAQAAQLAISVIGTPYGLGAKGWDLSANRYATSAEIKAGYIWYNATLGKIITKKAPGLDCSGLIYWAYNKAFGETIRSPKDPKSHTPYKEGSPVTYYNPVAFEGASQQWNFNVEKKEISKSDLKPGDVLYFDAEKPGKKGKVPGQDGIIDHAAMYVGDFNYNGKTYNVIEATHSPKTIIPRAVTPNTVDDIIKRIEGNSGAFKGFYRIEFPNTVSWKAVVQCKLKSPVSMNVTDPEGFTSTPDLSTGDMDYVSLFENGTAEDTVFILGRAVGDYFISLTPKLGVNLTDTYTLEFSEGNSTTLLAQNVAISEIPSQPYIVTSNQTTWIPRVYEHDIGVNWLETSKAIVGQNYPLDIDATIFNYGKFTETFSLTFYANATGIHTENVTLTSTDSTTITFAWNTSGLSYGNYTISAHAWPVQNETYTADNMIVGGSIAVIIPGDINGDGIVDIYDAIILAGQYNSRAGNLNWNPNADINNDGIVDIYDAIILAGNYNKHVP
jgi:cell wall-associated NlpC family hydrolase